MNSVDIRPQSRNHGALALSNHILLSLCGRGGNGEVFTAAGLPKLGPVKSSSSAGPYRTPGAPERRREGLVALWRPFPHVVEDIEFLQRLEAEELWVAKLLNHPNICQLLEAGLHESPPYLVLEHLWGLDLQRILGICRTRGARLPIVVAIHIAREVCRALEYAHEEVRTPTGEQLEVVHRGLHPSEVNLGFDGRVVVRGFVLGSLMNRATHEGTSGGVIKGRFRCMSPEQVRGEVVDCSTDIFALGSMLYEMLSGVNPFRRETDLETLTRIIDYRDLTPPSFFNRQVSSVLDVVVLKMLARERDARYQSAREVGLELDQHLEVFRGAAPRQAAGDWLCASFPDEHERQRQIWFHCSTLKEYFERHPGALPASAGRDPEFEELGLSISTKPHTLSVFDARPYVAPPQLGYCFGRYELRNDLGRSARFRSWQAVIVESEVTMSSIVSRPVKGQIHLKTAVLGDTLANAQRALDRDDSVLEEVALAQRIRHPGIARLYELGFVGQFIVAATEQIIGRDLAQMMGGRRWTTMFSSRPKRRISIQDALSIVGSVCETLSVLERWGLWWRPGVVLRVDLAPWKIRITNDGSVVLVGVGLSRLAEKLQRGDRARDLDGIRYLAPEWLRGESCDHRAAIYSLGTILYELLAGVPWIDARRPKMLHVAAMNPATPYPAKLDLAVPRAVMDIVLRAVEPEPEARFQTAEGMRTAILGALGQSELSPIEAAISQCNCV